MFPLALHEGDDLIGSPTLRDTASFSSIPVRWRPAFKNETGESDAVKLQPFWKTTANQFSMTVLQAMKSSIRVSWSLVRGPNFMLSRLIRRRLKIEAGTVCTAQTKEKGISGR